MSSTGGKLPLIMYGSELLKKYLASANSSISPLDFQAVKAKMISSDKDAIQVCVLHIVSEIGIFEVSAFRRFNKRESVVCTLNFTPINCPSDMGYIKAKRTIRGRNGVGHCEACRAG